MEHEQARAALGGGERKGKEKLHVHHMEIHRGHKKSGHIVTHHMRNENGQMPENPEDAQQQYPVAPGGLQDHIAASGIEDEPQAGGQEAAAAGAE